MDKSIQYTQVMSNFDSAYNTAPNLTYHSPIYIPISHQNRSLSPSLRSSNPKFNFDLYNPTDYHSESIDYPSPSSSVIIHHHPVYSSSPSQSISKLHQINDELCHTLAQCDLTTQSEPSPPPSHYYIHHYPISHETYRSRSRSPSEEDSSSTESEPIPKKHNARITYKAHIPRRQNPLSKIDQLLISTSDAYSQDDPMTIDLYPTRDQGFIKKIRNRPDNQNPWLADTSPIRRNSYSEVSTYRTPRGPYYGDKPLQPKSRLASGKERPRSSSVKSRIRPDSAPNPLRKSAVSFSSTAPAWLPSGTIKRPKFIGSHAPPSKPKPPPSEPRWNPVGTKKTKHFRAFDPVSRSVPTKPAEPVWNPPSKKHPAKHPRYFEPTLKPELTGPIRTQTEPVLRKQPSKSEKKKLSGDPKLKTRIANAESKVKSTWESTTTVSQPKPPIVPRPDKKITTVIPSKTNVKSVRPEPIVPVKKVVPTPPIDTDTGRSSLNDVPKKPMFESTPRNQSIDKDYADDSFEHESQTIEPPKKQVIPHPPPQIEKTPPKPPHTTAPEPDKGTKATIKDDVLIHGDDEDNRKPSPMSDVNNKDDDEEKKAKPSPILPKRKAASPKPDNRDDASVVDEEDIHSPNANDTDEDVEQNLETTRSRDNAAKDTHEIVSSSIPKADIKTPPRLKEPSSPPHREEPSPPPKSRDQDSYESPISSKKHDKKSPSTPPPAPTTTHEADDFFD